MDLDLAPHDDLSDVNQSNWDRPYALNEDEELVALDEDVLLEEPLIPESPPVSSGGNDLPALVPSSPPPSDLNRPAASESQNLPKPYTSKRHRSTNSAQFVPKSSIRRLNNFPVRPRFQPRSSRVPVSSPGTHSYNRSSAYHDDYRAPHSPQVAERRFDQFEDKIATNMQSLVTNVVKAFEDQNTRFNSALKPVVDLLEAQLRRDERRESGSHHFYNDRDYPPYYQQDWHGHSTQDHEHNPPNYSDSQSWAEVNYSPEHDHPRYPEGAFRDGFSHNHFRPYDRLDHGMPYERTQFPPENTTFWNRANNNEFVQDSCTMPPRAFRPGAGTRTGYTHPPRRPPPIFVPSCRYWRMQNKVNAGRASRDIGKQASTAPLAKAVWDRPTESKDKLISRISPPVTRPKPTLEARISSKPRSYTRFPNSSHRTFA